MQIKNEFAVASAPDTVFAFLLDVNRVAGCMPGAELSEVVDPTTFKGKVKIKVGPITVAYNGTAKIVERDDAARIARLEASGRETTGPGSAQATATMTVLESGATSIVRLETDFTVAGRVANFGRGVMEDVSKRLVAQMAACIKSQLESAPTPSAAGPGSTGFSPPADASTGFTPPAGAATTAAAAARPEPRTTPAPSASPAPVRPAAPVNALSLLFSVLWDRIKRLFGGG